MLFIIGVEIIKSTRKQDGDNQSSAS